MDSLASIGRAWSLMSAIMLTLVGGIFIMFGVFALRKATVRTTIGKVVSIEGSTMTVSYDNTEKDMEHVAGKKVGSTVTLYIDSSGNVSLEDTPKYIGWIMIGVGILVPTMGFLRYYFTRKSKGYAAMSGAEGVWTTFTQ